MTSFALAAGLGLIPLGICIIWGEVRARNIANICVLAAAGLFAVLAFMFLPFPQIIPRVSAGIFSGGVLYVLWRLNRVGGGDVKLATALVPFAAPSLWGIGFILLLVFSVLTWAALRLAQDTRPLPFGIPLVLTALASQLL